MTATARLLLFGLVAAAGLSGATLPSVAGDAEDCKSQGDLALAACDRAVASGSIRGPALADLLFARALHRMFVDRDGAIADLEESLRIDPTQPHVFNMLGHAYREKGDLDRAISNYSESIALEPDEPNGFYFRGTAHRDARDFEKAIADYGRAIAIDAGDGEFYNARGIASAANGEFDLAVDDYTIAIELKPDFAVAYSNRGDAYRLLGDLDRAVGDYGEAIARQPDDPVNAYKRGNAYRLQHNYDAAIGDYDTVIRLAGDEAEGYYERGVTRLMKKDFAAAIADLDASIERNPVYVLAFHARGLAHAAERAYDKAIANYSEAITLDPDNAERWAVRAWTSFLWNKPGLALADADTALTLDPNLVSAHVTRRRILDALGDTAAAKAELKEEFVARSWRGIDRKAEATALAEATEARQKARLEAEEAFLSDYEKDHPYVYPVDRTAAALGYKVEDETIVDIDVLSEQGRSLLVSFQRANRLRATGFLDQATFDGLLHAPVNPDNFKVSDPRNGAAEAIGDWFFSTGDSACTIWTKPVEIHGTFAPDFAELPLVSITRFLNDDGNALSQTYADGDLFAESAEVVVRANRELKTELFGGDYGPTRDCEGDTCGASGEVLKEFRAAQSFSIVGESVFGGELNLTYSAAGFSKAFQRLDRECGGGTLGSWLR